MDKKVFNHNNIRYERVSRAEAKKKSTSEVKLLY